MCKSSDQDTFLNFTRILNGPQISKHSICAISFVYIVSSDLHLHPTYLWLLNAPRNSCCITLEFVEESTNISYLLQQQWTKNLLFLLNYLFSVLKNQTLSFKLGTLKFRFYDSNVFRTELFAKHLGKPVKVNSFIKSWCYWEQKKR